MLCATACVTPKRVANLLVAAPQDRFENPIFKEIDTEAFYQDYPDHVTGNTLVNPFATRSVYLENAKIHLRIAELEPGDFLLDVKSEYDIKVETPKLRNHIQEAHTLTLVFTSNLTGYRPIERKGTIFLLHGYGTPKESLIPWAFTFAKNGYHAILVDLRGHGKSEGERIYFDTIQKTNIIHDNIGVFGWSYGSGVGIKWAARDPRIKTVVALGPYGAPKEAVEEVVRMSGIPIKRQLVLKALEVAHTRGLVDWEQASIFNILPEVHTPLFVIRGQHDRIASKEVVNRMIRLSPVRSKAMEIQHADHINISSFFHELEQPVLDWFEKKLSPSTSIAYSPTDVESRVR